MMNNGLKFKIIKIICIFLIGAVFTHQILPAYAESVENLQSEQSEEGMEPSPSESQSESPSEDNSSSVDDSTLSNSGTSDEFYNENNEGDVIESTPIEDIDNDNVESSSESVEEGSDVPVEDTTTSESGIENNEEKVDDTQSVEPEEDNTKEEGSNETAVDTSIVLDENDESVIDENVITNESPLVYGTRNLEGEPSIVDGYPVTYLGLTCTLHTDGLMVVEGNQTADSTVDTSATSPWYQNESVHTIYANYNACGYSQENMFYNAMESEFITGSEFNVRTVRDFDAFLCQNKFLSSCDLSGFNTCDIGTLVWMESMFEGCSSLTSLDLSSFSSPAIHTMESMFEGCSSLTSLDLSNLNTSRLAYLRYTFQDCTSLTSLNLSGLDTSHVLDMMYMFYNCSSLVSLDLSSFDTSQVTNMFGMFYNCSSLVSLDLSSFDTSKVTEMSFMFNNCSSLISLDLSNFNTSNAKYMMGMFIDCKSLTSLNLSNFNTSLLDSQSGMQYMFRGCSSLVSLDLSSFDTSKIRSMERLFEDCSSLVSLNLSSFDTSNVDDMSSMFLNCSSLVSLDLSSFNTSDVDTMWGMFKNCSSLTSLDLSNFDTSHVCGSGMAYMFSGCSSLTSLDLSSFNTFAVSRMGSMFQGCSSLTSLDLSNFNTSNATDMSGMFQGCSSLTSLDLSSFNVCYVESMSSMFENCSSLVNLDLSGFNAQHISNIERMFLGCSKLGYIDISKFNQASLSDTFMTFATSYDSALNYLVFNGITDDIIQEKYGLSSRKEYLESLGLEEGIADSLEKIKLPKRCPANIYLGKEYYSNINNKLSYLAPAGIPVEVTLSVTPWDTLIDLNNKYEVKVPSCVSVVNGEACLQFEFSCESGFEDNREILLYFDDLVLSSSDNDILIPVANDNSTLRFSKSSDSVQTVTLSANMSDMCHGDWEGSLNFRIYDYYVDEYVGVSGEEYPDRTITFNMMGADTFPIEDVPAEELEGFASDFNISKEVVIQMYNIMNTHTYNDFYLSLMFWDKWSDTDKQAACMLVLEGIAKYDYFITAGADKDYLDAFLTPRGYFN